MVTTIRMVAKNSFLIFGSNTIGHILQLFLLIYLARYLGDIAFGKYSFALAFNSFFLIISDLGLSVLSIREIARDTSKAGNYLTNISIIRAFLSVITVVSIVIVVNLMNYPQDTALVVYIIGGTTILTSFTTFFRSIFRAFEQMEYEAITTIAERLLVLISTLPMLYLGYGLIGAVSAMFVAECLILLLTLTILIKKFVRPALTFDPLLCKSLIKEALPFAMASFFAVIYFQTDIIMLSMMKGDEVVGWYKAAFGLVSGTLFLPSAFVGAIFPILSRNFASSRDSLMIIYEKALKYLAILGIPLGIGTTLIADKIIILLYGDEFANSIIALQILIWVATLLYVYSTVGYVLASINKQMLDTRTTIIAAFLNVSLNLILIPMYSYIGAGVASIVAQMFVFLYEFGYLQRNGYRIEATKIFLKPIYAGVAMGLIIICLKIVHTDLFVIIAIAIAFYAFCLYLLKTFDKSEMEAFESEIKAMNTLLKDKIVKHLE